MRPVFRLPSIFAAAHRCAPIGIVLTVLVTLGACGGGPVVTPAPAPTPVPDAPPPARVVARLALPSRIVSNWRVSTVARVTATDLRSGDNRVDTRVDTRAPADGRAELRGEQRIESRAIVSWTMDRAATGGLRATGQVDSFTVRSTLDAAETSAQANTQTNAQTPRRDTRTPNRPGSSSTLPTAPNAPTRPSLLLLDAVFDSSIARVVTRPLLANECDRPELGAVSLAKDVLIRIPDGVAVGDRWRDSTVSLVCRTGMPITVYTTTQHQLERLDDHRAVIVRTISATLEGKGGSAFRALELTGTSAGTQRAEVQRVSGVLEKLEGTSTLTLQVSERTPSGAPRVQQVVQRLELKAERVAR